MQATTILNYMKPSPWVECTRWTLSPLHGSFIKNRSILQTEKVCKIIHRQGTYSCCQLAIFSSSFFVFLSSLYPSTPSLGRLSVEELKRDLKTGEYLLKCSLYSRLWELFTCPLPLSHEEAQGLVLTLLVFFLTLSFIFYPSFSFSFFFERICIKWKV